MIPADHAKPMEERLIAFNSAASSVIEESRRKQREYVFAREYQDWKSNPIGKMNHTARKSARERAADARRHLVLICGREGANIIRTITGLAERGFAAFAKIPYQDAATQQALAQLMDDPRSYPDTKQIDDSLNAGEGLPRYT